ncbi:thiol:disulfide interchange protein DsbA/DsbL [Kitasatospora aureofaciens]|uniref:thiol:disulfide interchange protein DsbA/DsbL n=1 Tax=Kitasatospora aureofaciens TaxID=1894 RepID=UPI001C44726B|nr:thiol:disulfide interchange protein DsbA/DsbL [Kitasatospora aureofaciens]MBV6700737.1 thiol:disulfide interchange protein DsbA/DsbL [Kitasatospora aureofaciens]
MKPVSKALLRSTVLLAVAAGIAASPVQAGAATHRQPAEGVQYVKLDHPQPVREAARTEAVEFFWYDCGHSQQLEQPLQAWAEKHRADVALRRVPAIWPGSPEEGVQRGHARLYYTLERLGLVERLQTSAFRSVHNDKADLTTEATATEWAVRHGVDAQQFGQAYRSDAVRQSVDDAAAQFVRYGVNELPTVVVQGEYRTSPTKAGGVDAMPEVLDYLVQQEQLRKR